MPTTEEFIKIIEDQNKTIKKLQEEIYNLNEMLDYANGIVDADGVMTEKYAKENDIDFKEFL